MPIFVISGRDEKNQPAAYEIEAVDEFDARAQAKPLLSVIESAAPAAPSAEPGNETPADSGNQTLLSADVVEQAHSSLAGRSLLPDPGARRVRRLRRIAMICVTAVLAIIVSDYFIRDKMILPAAQRLAEVNLWSGDPKLFSKEKYTQAVHEYYVATDLFYALAVAGIPVTWLGVWSFLALRDLKRSPRQKPPAASAADESAAAPAPSH